MTTNNAQPTFAELLRRARRTAGLTQEGLAERAGVSTRSVSDLERGVNRTPRPDTLELLADALALSPEDRRAWERTRRRDYTRAAARTPSTTPEPGSTQTNLPISLTSLIGRERDIARVTALLRRPDGRLVTLTGPGGVGKTRLALAVGHALIDEPPDGVWFIDLAPVRDPDFVMMTVATTLKLTVTGNQPVIWTLTEALRARRLLLVVDNVEHVVDAVPAFAELLTACPYLTLLATSRMSLRLSSEREYPVDPLDLPGHAAEVDIDHLQQVAAVALFVERAQAIKPDFLLTRTNAAVVAAICHRLEGLPLAIELAAARIRLLPVGDLLARLDRRLALLRSDTRDIPSRQRALRDTIAWSYDLLSTEIQALFRRLAIFQGGWTLEAAGAVAGDDLDLDLLDGVERLIDHSLVRVTDQPNGSARYTMLETIREYGLEQLDASGDAERFFERHTDYYLALAEEAEPHLRGADQGAWLTRLDGELANLRAALAWTVERGRRGDRTAALRGLRLAEVLWWFSWVRGYMREGHDQLVDIVDVIDALYPTERSILGAPEVAIAYANALYGLATLVHSLGDAKRSRMLMTKSLDLHRELGQKESIASALIFLGFGSQHVGDFDDARDRLDEGITYFRQTGDHGGVALGLLGLGELALRTGDYEAGATRLEESVALFASLADSRGVAAARGALGATRLRQGNLTDARGLLRQSIEARDDLGDQGGIAWCLERIAALVLAEGQSAEHAMRATRLLGAAREMRVRINALIDPVDRPWIDSVIASCHARLSEFAFSVAWEAGRLMTHEQAIDEAVSGLGPA